LLELLPEAKPGSTGGLVVEGVWRG
jgi:hypothetical protein